MSHFFVIAKVSAAEPHAATPWFAYRRFTDGGTGPARWMWTTNLDDAIHFAREVDAQVFQPQIGDGTRVINNRIAENLQKRRQHKERSNAA